MSIASRPFEFLRSPRLALMSIGVLLIAAGPTLAHVVPTTALVLRCHASSIDADLCLTLNELEGAWQQDLPDSPEALVDRFGDRLRAYAIDHVHATAPDGAPWAVVVTGVTPTGDATSDVKIGLALTPPPGAPADRLTLRCDAIIDQLPDTSTIVTVASDWRNGMLGDGSEMLGTLRADALALPIDRSTGNWWRGFGATFLLGTEHIREGTDHLLFLLALLLPAPLLINAGRWGGYAGFWPSFRRIASIVTAFTIGHSCTLILGALGLVHLPTPFVESCIAFSILVSAAHAIRPLIGHREVYVAAGFGLVHGLAFGSVLTEYGLDSAALVGSMLGFNLGIEAFQLLVVIITMPWLVLLARAGQPIYTPFRIATACLVAIAASAWLVQRALGWNTPLTGWIDTYAPDLWMALIPLAVLALVATALRKAPNAAESNAPA